MQVEKVVQLKAKLDDVWAAFSDWGGIWKFQPWVVRSPLLSPNNEGPGASRRCEFVDGTSIVETVTKLESKKRIEMRLTETPKPMKAGTSSITLRPAVGGTEVTVVVDVELGMGPLNPIIGGLMMKPMMKKRIGKMLASLQYHLETDGKIDSKGNRLNANQVSAAKAA